MKVAKTVQLLFQEITRFMDSHQEESFLIKKFPKEIDNLSEFEETIDRDIQRLRFCVPNPNGPGSHEIDKTSIPVVYLKRLAAKLYSIDEYYQEILDFLIPIIYTEVSANKDIEYSVIEKHCMVIYENFLYMYLKDSYALALRYELILRKMDGYYITKPIDLEEIKGIFVELSHTALWFSRIFAYDDLVYIYSYLLQSELYTPYVFFLAVIDIIRERENAKPIFNLGNPSAILGEDKMMGLISKSKKLDKKIGHFFKKGISQSTITMFLVLAGVGVGAAIAAGVCMSKSRSSKE
ncbi:hypothetical protein NEIRO03_1572 [Nematocida sp. AWRm78]|nr:hypothetical protein NEIRO03_1572 [Nematocida sp. AWRm78]